MHPSNLPQLWYMLFPLTYAIHVTEEYVGGRRADSQASKVGGTNVTPTQFVLLTTLGLILIVAGYFLGRGHSLLEWLLVLLASVTLVNSLRHGYATLSRGKYNPGVVSGLLLWAPLGAITLFRMSSSMVLWQFSLAAFLGLTTQAAVTLISGNGDKIFGGVSGKTCTDP